MRELTLQELELIAGGTSTATALSDDIVVTANPGDDGGYYPPIFNDGGGGGGGWGGGGDWGGGGGGGGDGGDAPPADPDPDPDEIVVTAPRPTEQCPANDWWPDMFEDWGDVKSITPALGPWTQFWHDQGTWCFYDENDKLQGKFVDDPNGTDTITFTSTNGQASFNAGAATVSGGFASNDSSSTSITFHVSRVNE